MKKLICSVVLCLALFGCSNNSGEDSGHIQYDKTKDYGDDLMNFISSEIEEKEGHSITFESQAKSDRYNSIISYNGVNIELDMFFSDDSSLSYFYIKSDDLTIDNLGDSIGMVEDIYPYLLAANTSVSANIAEQIIMDISYISDSDYISKEIDGVSYGILYNSPLYESDVEGYVYTIDKPIGGYDFVPSEHPAYGRELTSTGTYSIMVSATPEE